MRAAIVEEFGKVVIKDVPKPSPKHEEALIRITTAGVCGSDVHMARGDWVKYLPPSLGHEAIGIVEELGPGAEKFVKKGDRVILGLGGSAGAYWCGACEYCLSGRPMYCAQKVNLTGAFGEFISVWAKALVKLPEEISNREVPLACAGLTAYSAVKKLTKFGVTAGKPIAIIGAAGGVGHYGVQFAKAFGYKVIGVDVGKEKMAFIEKLGADYAKDAGEVEGFISKEFGRGVYASIVFASKISAFELGLKLVRDGGLLVMVGLPPVSEGALSIIPFAMIIKGISIIPSLVGTIDEMRDVIQLCLEGKVTTHVGRTANFSEIGQVIKELEEGKFIGRAIIDNMQK
ncbi:MAG: alcohol dehydrogenase catalytic domain-containing protein [Promethearchaeota archaeon]